MARILRCAVCATPSNEVNGTTASCVNCGSRMTEVAPEREPCEHCGHPTSCTDYDPDSTPDEQDADAVGSSCEQSEPAAPSNPAPPLDLAQFQGHTPGPWAARRLGPPSYAVEVCYGNAWPLLTGPQPEHATRRNAHDRRAMADATLAAAAPALLAECRRQREEIARLREALASLLECSALNEDDNEDSTPAIEAARAVLAAAQEPAHE